MLPAWERLRRARGWFARRAARRPAAHTQAEPVCTSCHALRVQRSSRMQHSLLACMVWHTCPQLLTYAGAWKWRSLHESFMGLVDDDLSDCGRRAECAACLLHDLAGRGGPRCVAHRRSAGGALATRGGGAHVGPRTTRRSNMMLAGGCWPLWFSCSAGRGAGVCLWGPVGCCCLLGDRG